jgi:hypothetical protein
MATVRQQLIEPEAGWKRLDDTAENISYVGTWQTVTNTTWINGSAKYTLTPGAIVKFNFTGTKFAIIADLHPLHTTSVDVSIDVVNVGNFSEQGAETYKILFFLVSNLTNTEHSVRIVLLIRTNLYLKSILKMVKSLDFFVLIMPINLEDSPVTNN